MANKRLTSFTEKASPVAGDYAYIHDTTSGQERKTLLSALKTLILGGKTVGGTGAGDIADIDSAQTLTTKRLNLPGINSATTVTADSAEINKLDGCTATTAELNYLSGVTSAIQTQIANLSSAIAASKPQNYHYALSVTPASTSITITEATLRAAAGLSSSYRINYTGLLVQVAELVSSTYEVMPPEGDGDGTGKITYTTTTTSGVTHLSEIAIKSEISVTFLVTVIYTAVSIAGGS